MNDTLALYLMYYNDDECVITDAAMAGDMNPTLLGTLLNTPVERITDYGELF